VIKKVTLKDFQIHKNLELEFDKFTTLTGGSNGGKSAVLRAIIGLVRNDSPASYVRYGQKTLSVTIEFDDHQKVEWIKGEGTNKYILTNAEGVARTFDKVGKEAPEEVRDLLKLGPVAVKGSDKEYINFHSQLEAPFLISATPGSVAKLFGELTSASQLYTAVGEGNRLVRSTNSLKSTRKTDLDSAKESLDDYDDLEVQQEQLAEGSRLYNEARQLSSDIDACRGLLKGIETTEDSSALLEIAASVLEPKVTIDLDDLTEYSDQSKALGTLTTRIDMLAEKITTAEAGITTLDPVTGVDLSALTDLSTRIGIVDGYVSGIDTTATKLAALEASVTEQVMIVDGFESSIADKFNELTECASCGQELTEEAKTTLVEGRVAHATC